MGRPDRRLDHGLAVESGDHHSCGRGYYQALVATYEREAAR